MRRIFSHYTCIYPNLYLKNVVVELNQEGRITQIFPFDREIEHTEFYSGLISFIPIEIKKEEIDIPSNFSLYYIINEPILFDSSPAFQLVK